MAGEHQGHHLVADLAVGEGLAALAAGADQEAEDVLAAGVGVGAAAGDLAEDDLVEDLAARQISLRQGEPGPRSSRRWKSIP